MPALFLCKKEGKTMTFERECDAPENWKTDVILQRNTAGDVVEIDVPDDSEEVTEDAGNDKARG